MGEGSGDGAGREPGFVEVAGAVGSPGAPDRGPTGPALLSSPHSGRAFPECARRALAVDRAELLPLEDGPTHLLARRACAAGATLLAARYARAYVDLNRAPLEIDPILLGGDAPPGGGPILATPRVQAGLGVVPSRLGTRPIYREPLGVVGLERRVARGWAPYHRRLAELLRSRVERFGTAVLLDLHSMPPEAAAAAAAVGSGRPVDVALGDRHGASCDRRLALRAAELLEAEGLIVARNRPYAGAFIAERYGCPERGSHALQLEFRRDLFMDPATHAVDPAGLARLEGAVARLVAGLEAFAREVPGRAAAAPAADRPPHPDPGWPEALRAAD